MILTDLRKAYDDARAEQKAHEERVIEERRKYKFRVEKAWREYSLASNSGLDIERIRKAEEILEIYGGPKHGSTVFSISLKRQYRQGNDLSDEQRSDCIYYLESLKQGKLVVGENK